MSLGQLGSVGKSQGGQQTNKMYHVSVLVTLSANEDARFHFYSSSRIDNFTDLVNYVKNHGTGPTGSELIYCSGATGTSLNRVVYPVQIKYNSDYRLDATAVAEGNIQVAGQITSTTPSSYITCYEV